MPHGPDLEAASGSELLKFQAAGSRVNAIAVSPDGSQLATGDLENMVRIWNAADGRLDRVLAGHEQPVFHVQFSSDGSRLVSASQDATIKLWDLTSDAGVRNLSLARSAQLGWGEFKCAGAGRALAWGRGVSTRRR